MRVKPQPLAWTDAGAHEVVAGIYRIPVPLPLTGLPAVNCYVMEGPDGLVLVDPGWASDEAEAALRAGLADLGHRFDDISEIAVTHLHWDHYSLAVRLGDKVPRIRVGLGLGEARAFDLVRDGELFSQQQLSMLVEHSARELAEEASAQRLQGHEVDVSFRRPDVWYREGGSIELAQGALDVWETPGHTRGHIVLRLRGRSGLFTGDHVLPLATPAVGFEPNAVDHALSDYMSSLGRLLDEADMVMLPAHGPIGDSVHGRVHELLAHHEDRLVEVEDFLDSGLVTAGDIARAMPWTRKKKHIRDLELTHQMSALLEVAAHLDVLRSRGRAVRAKDSTGVVVWELRDGREKA